MISKGFVRCLAKISGDGYLNNKYIRYSNTCRELLEEFRKDITKEFGKIKFTEGIGNSGTPFIQIHGKTIINKFLEYQKDFRSKVIFIPRVIKNSSKSIQREYLRAFYDDEGCPSLRLFNKTKEWKRSISLTSNSIMLLKDVKKLLLNNFGIKSNKIIRTKKNSNYDRSFVLTITGKDNLTEFKDNIGFKHPNKIRRLNFILRSYEATSRNKEKFEKIRRELVIPFVK